MSITSFFLFLFFAPLTLLYLESININLLAVLQFPLLSHKNMDLFINFSYFYMP